MIPKDAIFRVCRDEQWGSALHKDCLSPTKLTCWTPDSLPWGSSMGQENVDINPPCGKEAWRCAAGATGLSKNDISDSVLLISSCSSAPSERQAVSFVYAAFSASLSSSSEKLTLFLFFGVVAAVSTSPVHGLHSLTNNPHLRQLQPSPSVASNLEMAQTKQ